MVAFAALILSSISAYWSHHFVENFLTNNGKKSIRLIIRRRQIHHSFWGIMSIAIALLFTQGFIMLAMIGYGIGNIWQHKLTHNRLGEPGLVFISKVK